MSVYGLYSVHAYGMYSVHALGTCPLSKGSSLESSSESHITAQSLLQKSWRFATQGSVLVEMLDFSLCERSNWLVRGGIRIVLNKVTYTVVGEMWNLWHGIHIKNMVLKVSRSVTSEINNNKKISFFGLFVVVAFIRVMKIEQSRPCSNSRYSVVFTDIVWI